MSLWERADAHRPRQEPDQPVRARPRVATFPRIGLATPRRFVVCRPDLVGAAARSRGLGQPGLGGGRADAPDDGADLVPRRRGGHGGRPGRAAGARHRPPRAAHPPGERPRLDLRRPRAGRGDPGDQGRPGDRGHRAVDQPERRAHAQPARADVPGGRRRPGPDGVGGHLPLSGPRQHARPLAAGGRRHAPARHRGPGHLRQPERAVRLPQARARRRPDGGAARRAPPRS